MSKAIVDSNLGGGFYQLKWQHNTAYAEQESSRLAEEIVGFDGPILQIDADLLDYDVEANLFADKLNDVISAASGIPAIEDTEPYTRELQLINEARAVLRTKAAVLKMERAAATSRKTNIDNSIARDQADSTFTAYCADFTEDIPAGTVVEMVLVPGEISGATLNIAPAYFGQHFFNPATMGQRTRAYSMTPAACFWNLALKPGWQRWRPKYRHGTITSLNKDNNLCSVEVDNAVSLVKGYDTGRSFNVNKSNSLPQRYDNVSITYMTCDAEAFELGDSVIVKFTDSNADTPVVVGFKGQPRKCPEEPDTDVVEVRWYAQRHEYLRTSQHNAIKVWRTYSEGDGPDPGSAIEDLISNRIAAYNSAGVNTYMVITRTGNRPYQGGGNDYAGFTGGRIYVYLLAREDDDQVFAGFSDYRTITLSSDRRPSFYGVEDWEP